MPETAWSVDQPTAVVTRTGTPRHSALVRVTHWLTTLCFLALLVSGLEIVVSHPRFYWGESGNVLTPALFSIPIPSSRATVPTGYGYVLPDQNGWSRYLHFEGAWVLVLTGALYVIWGALSGHFRNDLLLRHARLHDFDGPVHGFRADPPSLAHELDLAAGLYQPCPVDAQILGQQRGHQQRNEKDPQQGQ